MQILSDIADTAPNAQHDPQPPWSQIMLMDWHFGHFTRESNSVGSSSEPTKILEMSNRCLCTQRAEARCYNKKQDRRYSDPKACNG